MNNEEYECLDCTHLALKPPIIICTKDKHSAVIMGGELCLKWLYEECPLKKRKGE